MVCGKDIKQQIEITNLLSMNSIVWYIECFILQSQKITLHQ